MSVDPSHKSFDTIDTPAALSALLDALNSVETVVIDTEADSFHHFHHKTCLIQIALGDRCFIVDPLAGLDLSAMFEILTHKRLIFHDAGYDLRMLLTDFDFRPDNEIFDTMLAARLVGLENIGLSALLEQIIGVRVSKQNQRANWAKRPVADTLLAYAVQDIRHLEHIADFLAEKLQALGRLDWHREYCQWTVTQSQIVKTPEDPEKIWRIRGTQKLTPRQMAFVRAIWQWRQQQSDQADLSPFRILHNSQLLDLALWAERQKELHPDKLPRLPRHCKGQRRRELLNAMHQARQLEADQWPRPLPRENNHRPTPEVVERTERLVAHCRRIGASLELPPQLIASRKSLMAAVNTGADSEEKLLRIGWMRWQAELLLPALREVLA